MSDSTRDVLELLAKVLLRCWIIGLALQFIMFGAVLGLGDTVHSIQAALFGMSTHESELFIAGSSTVMKLCVGVLFFVPWLSIRLVLRTPNG